MGELNQDSPFVAILAGKADGEVIARDDEKQFALVRSLHPEGVVHWLAIPFEPISSIEELERSNRSRFLELIEFALSQTKEKISDYPELQRGFTVKFHVGGYETIPHAKLHILSVE